MKILQVIHGYLPDFRGGTELYVAGLTRELVARGHEVIVLAGTLDAAPEPEIRRRSHDGVEVVELALSGPYLEHWTRSFSPVAARLFADELRRIRPDLVHVHHWFRLTRNLLETCYAVGVPAVCTLHDLYASCPTFFRVVDGRFIDAPLAADPWAKLVPRLPWMDDRETADEIEAFREDFENELRLAHRVIVPSRAHGAAVQAAIALDPERLVVLPHGTITPPAPDEAPAWSPPEGDRRIVLGIWGHLFRMKGAHLVLEALQRGRLRDRFTLHVWGEVVEPRYRDVLEHAAEGLDVHWHGAFVPADVEDVALDVAVIPSLCSESWSFVLDEAFRLGLPAIVSGRGALAERIGEAGRAFAPESSGALAEVLRELADDPGLLATWRAAVPELTSMSDHADAMLPLYAGVVKRREMSRLSPMKGIAARRMERLARRVLDREDVMFGYLGRVRTETGRADHYESVTRKVMAEKDELGARLAEVDAERARFAAAVAAKARVVAALASEVEGLRAALWKAGEGEARPLPAPTGIEEHVPGLGAIDAIVAEDQRAIEHLHRRIAGNVRITEQGALIAFLAGEIQALRGAIRAVVRGDAELAMPTPELPAVRIDVPVLGTPEAIAADDTAVVNELATHVAGLGDREDNLLGVLGRELETFAEALRVAMDDEASAFDGQSLRDESADVEGRDRLERWLSDKPARLRAFREALVERSARRRRELEESLASRRRDLNESALKVRELKTEAEDARRRHELALREIRRERDEACARLGQLIEQLRKALGAIHRGELPAAAPPGPAPMPGVNVPGLGDIATIDRVNRELIEHHLAALRALRAELDPDLRARFDLLQERFARREGLIVALAAEIELLRRALVDPDAEPLPEEPVATGDADDDETVPGLGTVGEIRRRHLEMLAERRRAERP